MDYGEIGVIGAVALLLVKELIAAIRANKEASNGRGIPIALQEIRKNLESIGEGLERVERMCERTWAIHDVRDADGIPRWYFKSTLEKTVMEMGAVVPRLIEEIHKLRHVINEKP